MFILFTINEVYFHNAYITNHTICIKSLIYEVNVTADGVHCYVSVRLKLSHYTTFASVTNKCLKMDIIYIKRSIFTHLSISNYQISKIYKKLK